MKVQIITPFFRSSSPEIVEKKVTELSLLPVGYGYFVLAAEHNGRAAVIRRIMDIDYIALMHAKE